MKLHPLFLHIPKRSTVLAIVVAIAGFVAPRLAAQQQTLTVVPDHSSARIFIGSRENPTFFNVAAARVSGEVKLDPDNAEASTFNFKIYAADENPAGSSDQQALAGFQPVISFESQRVTGRSDGSLRVDGQLTVTQAEPSVSSSTGEDFSGPVYGPARLTHSSHEASFIFTPVAVSSEHDSSDESADARLLKAQQVVPDTALLLTASTSVNGEAFPELLSSVESVGWPAGLSQTECTVPSSVGEDYSGPQCSGNVVDAYPSPILPIQADEGYSGMQLVQPQGDQVTIHVGLALTGSNGNSAAASRQARPDAMGKAVSELLQGISGQ